MQILMAYGTQREAETSARFYFVLKYFLARGKLATIIIFLRFYAELSFCSFFYWIFFSFLEYEAIFSELHAANITKCGFSLRNKRSVDYIGPNSLHMNSISNFLKSFKTYANYVNNEKSMIWENLVTDDFLPVFVQVVRVF